MRPPDLVPASVDQTKMRALKVGTMEMMDRPADDCPTEMQEILCRHPLSFQWAFSEMLVEDNRTAIAAALSQGTAIAASDGSVNDSQGTLAFVIEGASKEGRLVGVNVIPGEPSSQSPCPSELGGVAGVLESLHCICQAHAVAEGKVEVGPDREQAMKEAFGDWPLNPSRPDCNMLQHICGIITASPLTFVSR
jgi:hypothetical protein